MKKHNYIQFAILSFCNLLITIIVYEFMGLSMATIIIIGVIDSFIIIPIHGFLLTHMCKQQNCTNCKMWNCEHWQYMKATLKGEPNETHKHIN